MAAGMVAVNPSVNVDSWQLMNSRSVKGGGEVVSTAGFNAASWHHAPATSTVLSALVKDSTYPDPRIGMNNFMIPDVSDAFNQRLGLDKYNHLTDGSNPWQQPWWYRTEIKVPSSWKNRLVWLNLDGINYRADVWVNGRQVASSDTIVGMFRRFRFNVTDYVVPGKENSIAVLIHQVDHPGDPVPGTQNILFGPNRGNAGDIHRDETLKMSGGWDCAPVVRDRNMGIYLPVWLEATGTVTFDDPMVTTTLPSLDKALVNVQVPLVNNGTRPIKGVLKARINSLAKVKVGSRTIRHDNLIHPITIKKEVSINPGDTVVVNLTADEFSSLAISNPPLWYPNGYGEQPMQHLALEFKPSTGTATEWETDFAIREIRTELMPREYQSHRGTETEYGLVFIINGKRIFARGGWLQPDILLDNSDRNIYDQALLLANMGVNTVGSEDMPTPPDAWLDAFDRTGLMWWHVFHQCYRMFPGRANQNNPDDHSLATAHVRDQIKRYRNHPSVVAWVGVNEVCPAADLYYSTRQAVRDLDSTRHFIPTTSTSWDIDSLTPWLAEDMPIGTTDDGAPDYNWAPSDYYFDKIDEVYTQMFKNELGMPAPPVYENLRKFITTIDRPMDDRDRLWPLDSVWAEHGAWCVNNFVYRAYDNAIRTFYSDPSSAEDYALKSQLLSADGYRAMIEAANHRAWDITTGVMLWKLNSCWPDVAWQVYDWYLTPNAAYYYTKKAMEPVHAQLNANTEMLSVVNVMPEATDSLTLNVRIDDFFGKKVWERDYSLSLAPYSYKELEVIPHGGRLAAVYLVTLSLRDAAGNEISHNTYWRYSQHQNFYWLLRMPQGNLTYDLNVTPVDDEYQLDIELSNDTKGYSFFKHLTLSTTPEGASIDPVIWSDNFITLLPGEKRHVTARVARDLFPDGSIPCLRIK